MKNVIISCNTLKNEVEFILERDRIESECIWLKEDLHLSPILLHKKIQQTIDSIVDADKIMLVYGHCGGALNNIKANCKIVLPKCNDCIEIMLHNKSDLNEMRSNCYFCSIGWLWGKEDLGFEYDRMKEKYGESKADHLMQNMFKNYQYFMYINTPIKDADETFKRGKTAANRLNLEFRSIQSDMKLISDMLNGIEDERFIIVLKDEYLIL